MAKEHHCPIHGAHVCNALAGRIHVCPICYTRWEEDVGSGAPAETTAVPV